MSSTDQSVQVYQLRIWIRHISPQIWHRLLVQSSSTIAQLHDTLQIAFGWSDEHLHQFLFARFAFGRLTVISDIAFQAAQGTMPTKAFEIGFGVIMGSTQADRRVTELVEIPVGGIAFPERVGLPVREAGVAVSGKISPSRQADLAVGHEEWSRRGVFTCRQVLVEEGADGTREEHFTRVVTFAVNANGALGPGNVVNVDGQRFLTAQTTIIDQPEERAVSWILDLA